MAIAVCPTCGTQFIDGVHHWSGTGKRGNPHDLAGLVCNKLAGDRPCINPCKGSQIGDTWEKRAQFVGLEMNVALTESLHPHES
jgi:hypothetical protein